MKQAGTKRTGHEYDSMHPQMTPMYEDQQWMNVLRLNICAHLRDRRTLFLRRNISAECDRVPEKATERRSDEGVKAQTYTQVVLRCSGAAKHNLPTANSQNIQLAEQFSHVLAIASG